MKKNKKVIRKLNVKRLVVAIIIFLFVLLLILVGIVGFNLSAANKEIDEVNFTISENENGNEIIDALEKEEVIRSAFWFKVYMKINGEINFKPGTYILSPKDNTPEIYRQFKEEDFPRSEVMITFKEGIGMSKIIDLIVENTDIKKEEIEAKLKDSEYLNSLIDEYWFVKDEVLNPNLYYSLEGYLFPDTYSISKDSSIEDIFGKMLDRMGQELDKYEREISASKYSIHDLLTLASVVELEGSKKDDREKIASVFYNRLNAGMDLGSCVTTYYAVKKVMGEDELYNSDINTTNPYNTRGPGMIGKLPVGPISNPGATSLEAVLKPINTNYYYFLSDLSGKLYFTKTIDEHNSMISKLEKEGNF